MRSYKHLRGVTLIELMVSITVGLIVSAAVTGLFLQSRASFIQNDEVSFIQDNGRYALKLLSDEFAMLDYFGGLVSPSTITYTDANLGLAVNGCGTAANWTYNLNNSFVYYNAPTVAEVNADFSCISSFKANTDLFQIKRVKGLEVTAASDLVQNAAYLNTNRTSGNFFKALSTSADPATGYSYWQYLVHVYFIDNDKLKRVALVPGTLPAFTTDELADGIEQFHVEFGIDVTNDAIADFFTSEPTVAQIPQAVVARIYVLAKGSREIAGYTNSNSYTLSDRVMAATNDAYYRRVYSSSVILRNPQAILMFAN